MTDPSTEETDPAGLVNLAEDRLGAQVIYATDDFFAPRERLLKAAEPIAKPGTFDAHGQWMDGWESRRRRGGGHDYCVIQLAYPGNVHQIDVNTRYFTGNYPPEASLEALTRGSPLDPDALWQEILPRQPLSGDAHNRFAITHSGPWRFLRLHIFPDGGIARLRVFGLVERDWVEIRKNLAPSDLIDLFGMENGGVALLANDEHYGSIRHLNRAGRGINMGDGWETRRRREPGHDWVILKLGHPGQLQRVIIDTAHYRGNYPERVSLDAVLLAPGAALTSQDYPNLDWQPLMSPQFLTPDAEHEFTQLIPHERLSHVRVNIHPDGGLSRVRLFGRPL